MGYAPLAVLDWMRLGVWGEGVCYARIGLGSGLFWGVGLVFGVRQGQGLGLGLGSEFGSGLELVQLRVSLSLGRLGVGGRERVCAMLTG